MKTFIKLFLLILIVSACNSKEQNRVTRITTEFKKSESKNVLVAAHRGDWQHAPENSILGIENCIKLGIDIVEVDVQKTKDGKLILMHDNTIDRMTTGKGKISDFTLDELKQFYLKNNRGGKDATLTEQKIPTLKEALLAARGKIMLNLDKSYGLMKDIYPVLNETKTTNIVIFKGSAEASQVKKDIAFLNNSVFFMPIISDKNDNISEEIKEHTNLYNPAAFELLLSETDSVLTDAKYIRSHGSRVWINTLWASLCAGYTDAKALENPDANWGHLIAKGVNIIQTDNPAKLLEYLKNKGLRNF